MTINKEKALFWLNRRVKALEDISKAPGQEDMAKMGLSYGDRQALMERKTKDASASDGELSSLREVIAFVTENA